MGLFKDNKSESRQFFEPDIQPDILEEKRKCYLKVNSWVLILTE